MELITLPLAYIAGIVTILNPCVLPILPIVLTSALQAGRFGAVALTLGLSTTFTLAFALISLFGNSLGLYDDSFVPVGGALLIIFGLAILIPGGQALIDKVFRPLSDAANNLLAKVNLGGYAGQFTIGAILGLAWSPCIGPTLGFASGLTATASGAAQVLIIALIFSAGVSTVLLLLSYGTQKAIGNRRQALMSTGSWLKPLTGVLMIAVGLFLMTGIYKQALFAVEQLLPGWWIDLTTRF